MSVATLSGIAAMSRCGKTRIVWHAANHPDEEANARVPEGSIAVAAETFHHDIQEMPSGNLLALSTELRRIEDYPTAFDSPDAPRAPASVIGDVVIEFSRDGAVVNRWKLMDMLDVYRLGYESLGGIWANWDYDELNWIPGNHGGWADSWTPYLLTPQGDLEWQFHQHAVEITDRGTLILFDNGNFRAMPPETAATPLESYSRAVEYEIDPEPMTVRQIWEYGSGQEIFYSPFISESDPLPSLYPD
jgi:hypothetical protein